MKKGFAFLTVLILLFSSFSFALAEEKETIEVAFMLTMNAAEERGKVQDTLNDMLASKGYNFQVNLVGIDFASWGTQLNLMLADGSVDLFNACWMPSLAVLSDNGSIAPLDDLLNTYGKGILETLGDYIECTRINGQIYGTPKVDAFSSKLLFFMQKDIADECKIDPAAIKDFATLTEALKVMHAAHPEMAAVASSAGGGYIVMNGIDYLGTEDPLGCLVLEENAMKVVNYYETDLFKNLLANGKTWNELGFFLKDPLNAQDGAFAYMGNNQAIGVVAAYASAEIGKSVQQKTIARDIYVAELQPDAWATTTNVTGMSWCIPTLSQHKEAAMQFLNALYTDADVANLICSGIEGVHYVKYDDGTIDFAEGLNAVTTGWPANMGSFWPNISITYPWRPDAPDTYQKWLATNDSCKKSPALGFGFDATNVADEVSACAALVDQYVPSLLLNVGDTDTLYTTFLAALKDAGLDDIIAEKQAQLDAWANR